MVGDGLSDRCAAREADHVMARDELLMWCRSEGIAATPFQSFDDVDRFARRLAGEPVAHRARPQGAGAAAMPDPGRL